MAEKKITRKVISKVSRNEITEKPKETEAVAVAPEAASEETRSKKTCFFCQSKTQPVYTDSVALRRFLSDRVKIVPKAKSNLCSGHQRVLTRHIKYARHLALLPFTPQV